MDDDVAQQLADLPGLTTGELCDLYRELYGEPVRTRHKQYLIRKVAWRIQALAEGDLSERARRRAAELANDADVRLMPPKHRLAAPPPPVAAQPDRVVKLPPSAPADPRLPGAGTALVRQYKGRQVKVIVLSDGFEFEGERYRTLTAVAQKVTGSHLNGYRFFGLTKPTGVRP